MINAAGGITWNGTPVDLAQVAGYLEPTKALPVDPELQVQPDPYARYFIVDNVMAVIKRSGVGKLGFVGNEQYARIFLSLIGRATKGPRSDSRPFFFVAGGSAWKPGRIGA